MKKNLRQKGRAFLASSSAALQLLPDAAQAGTGSAGRTCFGIAKDFGITSLGFAAVPSEAEEEPAPLFESDLLVPGAPGKFMGACFAKTPCFGFIKGTAAPSASARFFSI